MARRIASLVVGAEFENTIRVNTEVIVGGRGSQPEGYGKSFNLAPRSNNKANGGSGGGDIAFSGFIASAICRSPRYPLVMLPLTSRWRDNFALKANEGLTKRGEAFTTESSLLRSQRQFLTTCTCCRYLCSIHVGTCAR